MTLGDRLRACGVWPYLDEITESPVTVEATADLGVLACLRAHPDFKEGVLHGLHVTVGQHRTDFRSHRGVLGPGSVQIVIDTQTGKFYADLDHFSPYEDVFGFVGHAGEVVSHWWRRLRRSFREEDEDVDPRDRIAAVSSKPFPPYGKHDKGGVK